MKKLLVVAYLFIKILPSGEGSAFRSTSLDSVCDAWDQDKSGTTYMVGENKKTHRIQCKIAQGDSRLFGTWTFEMI